MMSLETIRYYERKAARVSRQLGVVPYHPESIEDMHPGNPNFRLPSLGDRTPRGWRRTETEFFVDSSGFGSESEPALTRGQFYAKLREHFAKNPAAGYAVTSAGQFQVYVTAFEKITPKAKKAPKARLTAMFEPV